MSWFYILDSNHNPVPVDDIIEWAMQFEHSDRIVEQTQINDHVRVSTVFLGLDQHWGGGIPILFETMVFGGEHDGYQRRYSTWDEAVAGHHAAIEMIFEVSE